MQILNYVSQPFPKAENIELRAINSTQQTSNLAHLVTCQKCTEAFNSMVMKTILLKKVTRMGDLFLVNLKGINLLKALFLTHLGWNSGNSCNFYARTWQHLFIAIKGTNLSNTIILLSEIPHSFNFQVMLATVIYCHFCNQALQNITSHYIPQCMPCSSPTGLFAAL